MLEIYMHMVSDFVCTQLLTKPVVEIVLISPPAILKQRRHSAKPLLSWTVLNVPELLCDCSFGAVRRVCTNFLAQLNASLNITAMFRSPDSDYLS